MMQKKGILMTSDGLFDDPEIMDTAKQINTCFSAHNNTLRSKFVKTESDAIKKLEKSFIKIRESGDIVKIVKLEAVYLHLEMLNNKDIKASDGEPHEIDGVEKARVSNGLIDARSALDQVRDIGSYEKYSSFLEYNKKVAFDREGLPRDGVREFVDTQCKALQNNMGSEIIDAAKSRNQERIKNLRSAEKIYKEKQREHMERYSKEYPDRRASIMYLSKQKSLEPGP